MQRRKTPAGMQKPLKVSLVNRSTMGGRHMLNADTMVQRINELPGFEARLEYVDGKTMRQQYEIFSQSDIIVYVHGAMMGNLAFLSPDAVVIEYAFSTGNSHLHGFSLALIDDLSVPASFIGIGPTTKNAVIPKLDFFFGRPEFMAMSLEDRQRFLESRECIRPYNGPCSHMGTFMIQAEWEVLQPAVLLAGDLVNQSHHRFLILDRDAGFRELLHRHPETNTRATIEFTI